MHSEIPTTRPRIDIIDALRGSALLGILLLHSIEHWDFYNNPVSAPIWLQSLNKATFDTAFFLFGGKAYAIFAMMFGVSFYIILNSWAKQGINFRGKFLWRLTILALLGYLLGIIYCGDILLTIAILGLPMVFIYKLSNRLLIFISIVLMLQIPSIVQTALILFNDGYQPDQPLHWAVFGYLQNLFANGSFKEVTTANVWKGQSMRLLWVFETGRYLQMMGLFIWGLLIGRSRLFEDAKLAARVSKIALISGLIGFVIIYPVKAQLSLWGMKDLDLYFIENLVSSYCNLTQMAVWAGGFYLLYQWNVFQKIFNLLIPYGRMSLSCYVTQALIGIPLFYGYGLGLFRYFGPFYSILVGIGIFMVQLICARLWLRYFIYGPLEWLWRALTFLSFDIPFRRKKISDTIPAMNVI